MRQTQIDRLHPAHPRLSPPTSRHAPMKAPPLLRGRTVRSKRGSHGWGVSPPEGPITLARSAGQSKPDPMPCPSSPVVDARPFSGHLKIHAGRHFGRSGFGELPNTEFGRLTAGPNTPHVFPVNIEHRNLVPTPAGYCDPAPWKASFPPVCDPLWPCRRRTCTRRGVRRACARVVLHQARNGSRRTSTRTPERKKHSSGICP